VLDDIHQPSLKTFLKSQREKESQLAQRDGRGVCCAISFRASRCSLSTGLFDKHKVETDEFLGSCWPSPGAPCREIHRDAEFPVPSPDA
jgi:hypothetical protein